MGTRRWLYLGFWALIGAGAAWSREINIDDVKRLKALPAVLEQHFPEHARLQADLLEETTNWVAEESDQSAARMRILLCTHPESDSFQIVGMYAQAMGLGQPVRIDLGEIVSAAPRSPRKAFKALMSGIVEQVAQSPETVFLLENIDETPRSFQSALGNLLEASTVSFNLGDTKEKREVRMGDVTYFLSTRAAAPNLERAAWGGGFGFRPNPARLSRAFSDPGLREVLISDGFSPSFLKQISRVTPVGPAASAEHFARNLRHHLAQRFPAFSPESVASEIKELTEAHFSMRGGYERAKSEITRLVEKRLASERIDNLINCSDTLAGFRVS